MRLLIKIVTGSFVNENRDLRELSIVQDIGCEVEIVAKGNQQQVEVSNGFRLHRLPTRPLGGKCLKLERIISGYQWAYYIGKLKPDYISCHDLIALFIGWLAAMMRKDKRPELIYDSHEYELGRTPKGPFGLIYQAKRITEKYLIGKCAFSIVVNESIRDEVVKIHKLDQEPIVVRNVPGYWEIDSDTCLLTKEDMCSNMGVESSTFIVMYHGAIVPGRGIERLIEAVGGTNGVACVVLGDGESDYIEKLKLLTQRHCVADRVIFYDAVEISELWKYVGAADVGVSLASNTCANHLYMLPNKIFECIQAETPIIASSFPEITNVVLGYGVGVCVDPDDTREISRAIMRLKDDKELYSSFKMNIKVAKKELCWELEQKELREAYVALIARKEREYVGI